MKVLGIPWDQNNDKLVLNLSFFAHAAAEEKVTKRVVISTIARLFDPLGIAAPACVLLKQLFQEICKMKIGWDDCLPSEISIRFQHIVQEMARVSSIEFDRSLMKGINPTDVKAVEIHICGPAFLLEPPEIGLDFSSLCRMNFSCYLRMKQLNKTYLQFLQEAWN